VEGGRQATLRGVLFTDMVGSTQLRSELGDDRADALRREHNAILGSAVTAHGGRVLRWTGDGIKADFPTASAALAAAMEMQREVDAYGRDPRAVSPFQIRVGVSAGEVVVEGNEAHGIAVIEAARLEPLAAPGEILATDLAQRLGERRVDAGFDEVGSFTLKGLDEPVTVVRVVDTARAGASVPFPRSLVIDRRFPLVGRGDEVQQVVDAWRSVRTGAAATLFLAGPAGIGKSRLAAQVADRAHGDGAVVLAGSCDSDLAVPYEPFAAAFAEVAGVDDDLGRAVASGTGSLGPLFPARRRERIEDGGASDRFELFEAVVALLERLTAEQPVVLVLDDLHWATPSTVQLLRHLMRRTDDLPLLVLGSYRIDEVPSGHPLHALLTDRSSGEPTVLRLGGLGPAEVTELVAARVPAAPSGQIEAFARRLHEESAGSPFFTCELLHHLTTTGQLAELVADGDRATLPLPDSVRDVVDQRLTRLPDGTEDVLAMGSIIGAAFDLDLLAQVCELDEVVALDRCEALVRMALVQEVDAGRFAFAHALVRTAVLDRLSPSRKVLAHRQVAQAIEALGRADNDELARHWFEAGVADRANEHLERAAERDLEAYAFESAGERYQALLDYHRDDPTGDAAPRARAWLGLGLARRALGQEEFLDAIHEAGRLGRRLRDVDVLAEAAIACIWPGNFFVIAGAPDTANVELCEDALAVLDESDPRRPRVLSTLAAHLAFDPDRERRLGLLREAQEIARRIGDPELIGIALVAEHMSLWDPTTIERRGEICVEVSRMARSSGDVELEFFGGFLPALRATEHGRPDEAKDRLRRLADTITASQNPYFAFLADRLEVTLDVFAGVPDAQSRVDDLAKRYTDTYADTAGTWAIQTGHLARQSGTLAELAPAMRAMVESTRVGNWQAAFGLALLAAGERDEAEDIYEHLDHTSLDYFWLTTMQASAELAVALGRRDGVATHLELLLPHRELVGVTASGSMCFGQVLTTLGELALALDDHDRARADLEEAAARAVEMGARYESVRTRRLLATVHARDGRTAEATELTRATVVDARQHGFGEEERLLEELALLG
jgi:class 3 adenylate cyclase/tetratricopeptide (TPR) repeat protein